MKWTLVAAAACAAGCINSAPVENPSSPAEFRSSTEEAMEARQLEKAEADCAGQGKHAETKRVEGETVYSCSE
jgi:hypothetical protein